MESKIIGSIGRAGKNASIERYDSKNSEASDFIVDSCMDIGKRVAPRGLICVGVATVFYYERADGAPGGAYQSVSGIANLNETFADGGIKELNRHCAAKFGRNIKGAEL